MGVFQSKADLKKDLFQSESQYFQTVGVSMCGWRMNQEDAEILQCPYDSDDSGLFAVFDGHGGDIVSKFAAVYFPLELKKNAAYIAGDYETALKQTFNRMDECILSDVGRRITLKNLRLKDAKKPYEYPLDADFDQLVTLSESDPIDKAIIKEKEFIAKNHKLPDYFNSLEDEQVEPSTNNISDILAKKTVLTIGDIGGCTANVGLIKNGKIYIANAGDSRSVACKKSGETLALSFDHKPENDEERNRIESAGGYVEANRVNGNLNLSRAFGDFTFKVNGTLKKDQQMVIAEPEVLSAEIKDVKYIILACDGIYDCVSNEELVEWFSNTLEEFDSGKFKYTPKLDETQPNPNQANNKSYIEELKSLKENEGKEGEAKYTLSSTVEKFLDSIVAEDTSQGKGTDNMTCLLVRVKSQ